MTHRMFHRVADELRDIEQFDGTPTAGKFVARYCRLRNIRLYLLRRLGK